MAVIISLCMEKRRRRKPNSRVHNRLLAASAMAVLALSPVLAYLALSHSHHPPPDSSSSYHFVKITPLPQLISDPIGQAIEPPPLQPAAQTATSHEEPEPGPYHDWKLFAADFQEMMCKFKIFTYPHVSELNQAFADIFLPNPDPFNPKIGNYFSEHMFKISLLKSSLITPNPEQAHLFFMPFSINSLRNDPRVRSETSIARFVAQYATNISRQFSFWNATLGADHFYVSCHSVGREAASKHQDLWTNAIQVTCSSSYFQRLYVAHKDIGLPQVWPRPIQTALNPPNARYYILHS